MKNIKNFPFEKSRRITLKETTAAKKAIERKTGIKRPMRGRPAKGKHKYVPTSIRLHPKVLSWAKREAKKRGIGYQTVINESLIKKISASYTDHI
ncbi:MAG: BrnA antitoxin family protein [Bdellovibrionales bacterium]|nr:BrnA antitoxin family protein [Bdellovibrionales bacterium]